jgi:hypothetical protein
VFECSHIFHSSKLYFYQCFIVRRGRDRDRWYLDLQLPVQSVPITIKVVSLNTTHGEVYSIQHYVIKFVSDAAAGWWFPPPIKLTATM